MIYFKKGDIIKKLNLGCGNDIRKNWLNYDIQPVSNNVEFLDLNCLPLPFPNDYADEILLNHVFEHLNINRYEFMKEISRVLKKNGKLTISVPVNHQCVEHEPFLFTMGFFNSLKTEQYGNLFKDIKISYTNNNVGDIIWKIKEFLFWILKKEITYEFKK